MAVAAVSLTFAFYAANATEEGLRQEKGATEAALLDVQTRQQNLALERTRLAERRLAENHLDRALAVCALEAEPARGMLWLARALEAAGNDPDLERIIRINLAGWRHDFPL